MFFRLTRVIHLSDNDIFIANGSCAPSGSPLRPMLTGSNHCEFLRSIRRVSSEYGTEREKVREREPADDGVFSSSLGVPIGNAIFLDGLRSEVPKLAPGVSPDLVIRAGALNLPSLTTSSRILHGLREAYAVAISHVNIFLVVVICISVPTACGMEWLNIKKVSAQHEEQKKRGVTGEIHAEEHELRAQEEQGYQK